MAKTVPPISHAPPAESLPPTVVEDIGEMFLRLGFSQTVTIKLVDDQWIDSLQTLASLSNKDITTICNVIHRPGKLVSGKTPDRRNQISILAATNLKLVAFMFKIMEHCSKDYDL